MRWSSERRFGPTRDRPLTRHDGYPDETKVRAAAEDVARSKPHLAKRRAAGDVDQGARPEAAEPVNLAGLLRDRAG